MSEYVTRTATLTELDDGWWCARMEVSTCQVIAVEKSPVLAWMELQRQGHGDLVPGDAETLAILVHALAEYALTALPWIEGPLGCPDWLTELGG